MDIDGNLQIEARCCWWFFLGGSFLEFWGPPLLTRQWGEHLVVSSASSLPYQFLTGVVPSQTILPYPVCAAFSVWNNSSIPSIIKVRLHICRLFFCSLAVDLPNRWSLPWAIIKRRMRTIKVHGDFTYMSSHGERHPINSVYWVGIWTSVSLFKSCSLTSIWYWLFEISAHRTHGENFEQTCKKSTAITNVLIFHNTQIRLTRFGELEYDNQIAKQVVTSAL